MQILKTSKAGKIEDRRTRSRIKERNFYFVLEQYPLNTTIKAFKFETNYYNRLPKRN